MESDGTYIRRTLAGDRAAFRALVERHQARAYGVALGILHDPGQAQDVLQEAFIKVYKGLRRFREDAAFATWLHIIVVRTALDAAARGKQQPAVRHDEQALTTRPGESADREQFLRQALQRLKDQERLVLQLFYLQELSLHEIQRATRWSPSKIRVTLHRARKSLDAELERMLGDEKHDLL